MVRPRCCAERKQPRRDTREKGKMIVGVAGALERDTHERAEICGKGWRDKGIALNDPGIAIRRLLADSRAIDQCHAQAALDEMQRDRRTDDSGAQNHCVGACHSSISPASRGSPLLYGMDRGRTPWPCHRERPHVVPLLKPLAMRLRQYPKAQAIVERMDAACDTSCDCIRINSSIRLLLLEPGLADPLAPFPLDPSPEDPAFGAPA